MRDYQTVRIKVVDGKNVTSLDPAPEFCLRKGITEFKGSVVRQLCFKEEVVPEEYAYVLQHEGITYEPSHHFRH